MKNKKTLLIVIIILLILLVVAGALFTYVYFGTDLLKSDKELFAKYTLKMGDEKVGLFPKTLEEYENKKNNNLYRNEGKFNVNTEILVDAHEVASMEESNQQMQQLIDYANNTDITFSGNVDSKNKKAEQDIRINYTDNINLPFKYKQDGDLYALQADILAPNYIAIENNNLPDLLEKLGVTNVSNIPNKIEFNELQSIKLSDEEKSHIQEQYIIPMYNDISEDKFSKTVNADGTTTYTLSTTNIELKDALIKMLQTLNNDTLIINKINNIWEELRLNLNINDNSYLKAGDLQNLIQELSRQELEETSVKINLTQKDGNVNKFSITSDVLTFEMAKEQTESNILYNIATSAKIDETNSIQTLYKISCMGLNTNKITEDISFSINMQDKFDVVYSFNNTVDFENVQNIEGLGTDTVILNNYTAEQLQPFIAQIFNIIAQTNSEQMSQLNFPAEMLNPMSVWITGPGLAVYIYNSASEVIDRADESKQLVENALQEEELLLQQQEEQMNELLSNVVVN